MEVIKTGRHGAFDNVDVNADMGADLAGCPVIAAPFGADLCLHLRVRWGLNQPARRQSTPLPCLGWSSGAQ